MSGQNYSGSLDRDRYAALGMFGRFLPVGFYYKAFHTPRSLFPFWENIIRKAAGLGDDRAEQFVAVQAALHQRLRPACAHLSHRLRRRIVAVLGVDDLERLRHLVRSEAVPTEPVELLPCGRG